MKDLVKTSAQVVASLGSFEKALEVTKDKGSLFVKRYFDSFDTDKEAERKASKFFDIYDYLRSFHCEMHKPQNTLFILNHNIAYDKFMDEKAKYLSKATPKWAQ